MNEIFEEEQFKVVGTYFRGKETQEIVKTIPPGEPLELVPEPENPHDSNAIKIFWNNIHIGYVDKEKTNIFHTALDLKQTFETVGFVGKYLTYKIVIL